MRSSAKGKDLTTKAQTLTSLSHWSASQSQFHHHGREESLRLKFNTLKYQLSKLSQNSAWKKTLSFGETSFSTGSFPLACASFQVIIHAPIPRKVIDGYAWKWHFRSQLKMTKKWEKGKYVCLVVITTCHSKACWTRGRGPCLCLQWGKVGVSQGDLSRSW